MSAYRAIIEKIFIDRYEAGMEAIPFTRDDIAEASQALNVRLPKNIGDVIYSFRYRAKAPESISQTQPVGAEWVIEGAGPGKYIFKLVAINRISPNPNLIVTKIPDATPEIIYAYALNDEQALLAKIRYNKLVDVFLGISAYSLQNHLRSTVPNIGQIEIDEVYVGIDKHGRHYVVPVQAKSGSDQLGATQAKQDVSFCRNKYPDLYCRPVSVQFMDNQVIAMFELAIEGDRVRIVDERHYILVPYSEINSDDLAAYSTR